MEIFIWGRIERQKGETRWKACMALSFSRECIVNLRRGERFVASLTQIAFATSYIRRTLSEIAGDGLKYERRVPEIWKK